MAVDPHDLPDSGNLPAGVCRPTLSSTSVCARRMIPSTPRTILLSGSVHFVRKSARPGLPGPPAREPPGGRSRFQVTGAVQNGTEAILTATSMPETMIDKPANVRSVVG